jgi:hypothetical protein
VNYERMESGLRSGATAGGRSWAGPGHFPVRTDILFDGVLVWVDLKSKYGRE